MLPFIGILSAVGVFIGIYAVIRGNAPRVGIKSRKAAAIVLVVSFVLFVTLVSIDSPGADEAAAEDPVSEPEPVEVEELSVDEDELEPPAEELYIITEAAQNAFVAWESQVMFIHGRADNAAAAFTSVLADFGEGKTDIYNTYNEAKKTRDIVNKARGDIVRVALGDELSEDHKSRLKEAANTLSTGLHVKTEALDLILKFLDDPKPSYVNEAGDNFDRAYLYMLNGLSEITMVKNELGLFEAADDDL